VFKIDHFVRRYFLIPLDVSWSQGLQLARSTELMVDDKTVPLTRTVVVGKSCALVIKSLECELY
jgi:hypothetical protein